MDTIVWGKMERMRINTDRKIILPVTLSVENVKVMNVHIIRCKLDQLMSL